MRGDLIEVYKILTHKYDPEVCSDMIKLRENSATRTNKYKIFKEHTNRNSTIKDKGFPHRVVNVWNSLPERVVTAPTIMCFERRLDKVLSSQDLVFDEKAKLDLKLIGTGTGSHLSPVQELDELDLEQEA